MLEEQSNVQIRKFALADKWVKMTDERARIDAKVKNANISSMIYKRNR
jgi:hypothetical protein